MFTRNDIADVKEESAVGAELEESTKSVSGQHPVVHFTVALLAGAIVYNLWHRDWGLAYQAGLTLAATMAPVLMPRLADIELPRSMIAAMALFICATMFLGEALDFYEKFWWWDMVLHTGSAIMLAVAGFMLVLMFFHEKTLAAAPSVIALFSFTFAVSIGVVWEVYEYGMDQTFGTNMQKSGLDDTMSDLILDCLGAAFGAWSAYLYLTRHTDKGLASWIAEFKRKNRQFLRQRPRA